MPEGFPFDLGWPWIIAIGFGANATREAAEQAAANTLGLDTESLELAREITALSPEARSRICSEIARWRGTEYPEVESPRRERRDELVAEEAIKAREPIIAKRIRTVQVGLEEVKDQAKQYLRAMYTKEGDMICQVCGITLPFKLDDGNYYFEAVCFLNELKQRHTQNYLALCPNHSAMFQYANASRDRLLEAFAEMTDNHLTILLAQQELAIYFTSKHRDDLKAVIRAVRKQDLDDR